MGKKEQVEQLTTYMANFVSYIGKVLPDDIIAKIRRTGRERGQPAVQSNLSDHEEKPGIWQKSLNRPSCQDTGVLQFWVKCGTNFPLIGELEALLKEAVVKATFEAPLRHNSVETFDEYNTGKNVGKGTPTVFWDIVPDSDKCEIYTYMAGGGCTLPGKAMVLMPGEGYEGVTQFRYGCYDLLWLKCLSATS
ncbi:MAG: fumarate hydratase [Lachnospiraceae bacterium]